VTATGTTTIRSSVVGTVQIAGADGTVLPLDTSLPGDLAFPGATGSTVITGSHSATATLAGSVTI
jgi:hypothetical protein